MGIEYYEYTEDLPYLNEAALEAIINPLRRADKKDWDRLETHLAKDMSGYGQFWQAVLREVQQAMASIKEEV